MALVIGLAFPLGWGLFELVRYRKYNFIAVLGIVSVGLTGGIGLMELDAGWLAIKEAAVPAVIGIAVLVSTRTRYPLVRTLLYNPSVLNVDKIQAVLKENGSEEEFEARLLKASYFFSLTFLQDDPGELSHDRYSLDDHDDRHFLLPLAFHSPAHRLHP